MYHRLYAIIAFFLICIHNTSAMEPIERIDHKDEQFNEYISRVGGVGASFIPFATVCTIKWLSPMYVSPFSIYMIAGGMCSGLTAHLAGVCTLFQQCYGHYRHHPYSLSHFTKPRRECSEREWRIQDLFDIVEDGDHPSCVESCIHNGANVHARDDINGWTPLQLARYKGHHNTARILSHYTENSIMHSSTLPAMPHDVHY